MLVPFGQRHDISVDLVALHALELALERLEVPLQMVNCLRVKFFTSQKFTKLFAKTDSVVSVESDKVILKVCYPLSDKFTIVLLNVVLDEDVLLRQRREQVLYEYRVLEGVMERLKVREPSEDFVSSHC